jgi:predicted outer membrane repeat protein
MMTSHSKSSLNTIMLVCMLIALIGGAVVVTPAQAALAPRFAATDGVATGLCDSWANACNLAYALVAAGEQPTSAIWVKEGTYTPANPGRPERTDTFSLITNVGIYGGFVGTEKYLDQRNPSTHVTTLSGEMGTPGDASDNSYHVVTGASGSTVDGFTISGGYAGGGSSSGSGGGIYNTTGDLTIANDTFTGNYATYGSGIYHTTGTLTVTNSTFSSNTYATSGGGAIYNTFGTLTISGSTFTGNSGTLGGGIVSGGTMNITTSTFSVNSANRGGGIYNFGTLNITNSTFYGNNANAGDRYGGGIFTDGSVTITNSTFSSNAGNYGGGVYIYSGTVNLTNNTFSENSAVNSGGGIYNASGANVVTLRNTILDNSTSGGNCSGAITYGGNNLEDGTTCGWGTALQSMSSTDPLLGSLADNGGATQTFALLTGSPAINAGDDAICAAGVGSPDYGAGGVDQRGIARPQGWHCDIGSYELVLPPILRLFLPLVMR